MKRPARLIATLLTSMVITGFAAATAAGVMSAAPQAAVSHSHPASTVLADPPGPIGPDNPSVPRAQWIEIF